MEHPVRGCSITGNSSSLNNILKPTTCCHKVFALRSLAHALENQVMKQLSGNYVFALPTAV
jgi:hypothetical protein